MMLKSQDICLKGAREICDAVGENSRNIIELVRDKGLPAWKREDRARGGHFQRITPLDT